MLCGALGGLVWHQISALICFFVIGHPLSNQLTQTGDCFYSRAARLTNTTRVSVGKTKHHPSEVLPSR